MQGAELGKFLVALCERAKEETLPRFRACTDIENKLDEGFDPVTAADRKAEYVIREMIMRALPDHGIIGEEYGSHNQEAEYQWIIDPIDGTRAFISGIPVWGTLIGLYRNGEPLAGVMDQPYIGERFIFDGESAFKEHGGSKKPLSTSQVVNLELATLLTTDPRLFQGHEGILVRELENSVRLSRYGTDCYGYVMVAEGQVELVVESGLQIYDMAALLPIVEAAGGVFTDWEGNSNPNGGRVIAAANNMIHEQALAILNR